MNACFLFSNDFPSLIIAGSNAGNCAVFDEIRDSEVIRYPGRFSIVASHDTRLEHLVNPTVEYSFGMFPTKQVLFPIH